MKWLWLFLIGFNLSPAQAETTSLENQCFTAQTCYAEDKICPIIVVIQDDPNTDYIVQENLATNKVDGKARSNFLDHMNKVTCPQDYKPGLTDKKIIDKLLKKTDKLQRREVTRMIEDKQVKYCEEVCQIKLSSVGIGYYQAPTTIQGYSARTLFLSSQKWLKSCNQECNHKAP